MISLLKKLVEKVPYSIGKYLTKIPYKYRLGKNYETVKLDIEGFASTTIEDKEKYIVKNFNTIFQQSKNNSFYKRKYTKAGIIDLNIQSISDISKVPILTKEEIRSHLKDFKGASLLNTGGTTGQPFAFYVDKFAWSREWAHMHYIWKTMGYTYTTPKFTFRGKDLEDKFVLFNPVHNEFIINTYLSASQNSKEFLDILVHRKVQYFHGYPSAIYNFLKEIEEEITKEQKKLITDTIKCCFLGSEYPTPQIVHYLKNTWNLNYISWYGHSEMCVLAYSEMNNDVYKPLITYGYTEVVDNKLIGTSYHNHDMPLIRYDTGDVVNPIKTKKGILYSFSITEGRVGDFIIDENDKKIPLTAFIFGRHHQIFNHINHIQVFQEQKGKATLVISNFKNKDLDVKNLMNLENIKINFDVVITNKPVLTNSGKVSLKINKLPSQET